jgi:hypothetical protein
LNSTELIRRIFAEAEVSADCLERQIIDFKGQGVRDASSSFNLP